MDAETKAKVTSALWDSMDIRLATYAEERNRVVRWGWGGTNNMSDDELIAAFFSLRLDDTRPDLAGRIRPVSAEEVATINRLVRPEGWAVLNDGDIERDDDMEVFRDDGEALEFVQRLADSGSAIHKRAMVIHQRSSRGCPGPNSSKQE